MTIAEAREKCKKYLAGLKAVPQDILLVLILLLACFLSFGLGYMAGKDAGLPADGAGKGSEVTIDASPLVASTTGQIVASKNGTKYYFPWCAGVDRISDTNKVWFNSVESAKAKGYSPASNCKGL